MAIPDYQTLMLPVLLLAANGEVKIGDIVERLADEFGLSENERTKLLPSGKQTVIANKAHWAKTYLKQAGLVTSTRRGFFEISEIGKSVLAERPSRVDVDYLMKFPEFVSFRNRTSGSDASEESAEKGAKPATRLEASETPEEIMRARHLQLNSTLGEEMLDRILSGTPAFFERLIVQLLLSMGFGGTATEAGRAIGRSGDDGVDGVVDQDALGLDRVYIQAKRYKADNSIGPAAIREFSGSLELHKATKGIFVTTSGFSKAAFDTAERLGKRIVLVDGQHLSRLMIKYNVGCRTEETLEIKRLDEDFFE
jgi:restriction system protein